MILKPYYDCLKHNESILLTREKVSVNYKGQIYKGDAEIHLNLAHKAGIYIHTSLSSFSSSPLDSGIEVLTVGSNDIPGFVVWETIPVDGKVDFVWCPRQEPVIGYGNQGTSISKVVFHLFNYGDLWGTRRSKEQVGNGWHAIHHVDLVANGWGVELKSLNSTSNTLKILKERGGYGFTHMGCLKREDSSSFDGKAAEEILTALRFFLSFSKGIWCNPCLAVGFDNMENKVWEAWSSPERQWDSPISWFCPHHSKQLADLFPGFMAKWENNDWRDALQEVIYWYLNSNCSTLGRGINIDAGIILTQAAIERLAFEYAVKYKRLIEAEGFKNLRASDKFRLLFSSLDIPIDIPASLPELSNCANNFNWIDAPQAITDIRNSLVHPEHKRRGEFDKIFFPAWNLGQWYLELTLLRICEYSGTYSNRLTAEWVGQTENVPWAEP